MLFWYSHGYNHLVITDETNRFVSKVSFFRRKENAGTKHCWELLQASAQETNGLYRIVYALDFTVTPHQLRHTYITNLIAADVDPKTVQYLAGHENSKVTMDIYAKAKYNRTTELSGVVNNALNIGESK